MHLYVRLFRPFFIFVADSYQVFSPHPSLDASSRFNDPRHVSISADHDDPTSAAQPIPAPQRDVSFPPFFKFSLSLLTLRK